MNFIDKLIARMFSSVLQQLGQVLANQKTILARLGSMETKIMATIADIETEVTNETTVDQSVLTLVQGLVAQVEANKNDPAKLDALLAKMKANSQSLADAVVANTPAAPSA